MKLHVHLSLDISKNQYLAFAIHPNGTEIPSEYFDTKEQAYEYIIKSLQVINQNKPKLADILENQFKKDGLI